MRAHLTPRWVPAFGLAFVLFVSVACLAPVEAATLALGWRYRSNADLASALDALHAGPCSGMSSLTSIGTSVKGEEIRVLEVSADPGRTQPKPTFAFLGNMHGDEPVGRELILRLAELVCVAAKKGKADDDQVMDGIITVAEEGDDLYYATALRLATSTRLFFAPSINPDGFQSHARNNANGKDLNRDWPDQYNEVSMPDLLDTRQPETASIMKWSKLINATAALNFHEGAVVANYPWDAKAGSKRSVYAEAPDDTTFKRLASAYANGHPTMHKSKEFVGGITNGANWYPLWGGMQDWHYIQTQTMDITIEVNDEKWPEEEVLAKVWRDHRGGIFACAEMATKGALRGFVRDAKSNKALPSAALIMDNRDMPFAPNALGFFARPVSGNDNSKRFDVTITASHPGYVTVSETVFVDPVEGGDVSFALVKTSDGGDLGDIGASIEGGLSDGTGNSSPRRLEPATVNVENERRHPAATWGAVAFVVVAVAATVRRRRARGGVRRGGSRVEGV